MVRLTEAHRRLEQIGWELMYLEATGDAKKAKELRAEKAEIERELDIFYNDPMTE